MKWLKASLVVYCAVLLAATVRAAELPAPWQSKDIGSVGAAGSATFTDGAFTVAASGTDIWSIADGFRFIYQPVSGDGTIVARVSSLENANEWTKAGVMIRGALTPESVHVFCCVTPGNSAAFQRRTSAGAESEHTPFDATVAAPYWVKLVRAGDSFTGYVSADGKEWKQVGTESVTVALPKEAFWGIAVTAHSNDTTTPELTAKSVVDSVTIARKP